MRGVLRHGRLPGFDRRWRLGLGHPVGWGWAIVNFVFWIGIGHAGTLISAILFLLRQRWRTAVNRAAEAMTLFAVMCAGIFPAIHVGRVWLAWWLFPIPNSNNIWPQFRSPLMWDVFAVSTYFTVSLLFWYMGLLPDLATMRDRAEAGSASTSMVSSPWAGPARTGIGATTKRPTCCWPGCPRRWCSRCTASSRLTLRCRSCPDGTPRFSRRISWPAPSSPGSAWC